MKPAVLIFYLVPILVAAFLATLASATIGSLSGWGFPLQWKSGGTTIINGNLVAAPECYNWTFFAADLLLYITIGYALLYVCYVLAPSVVNRAAILSPKLVLTATLSASVITLATGWFATGQLVSPGGFWGQTSGYPLAWKTTLTSCPPPCLQANGTNYDWILFAGDLLFYLTSGYAILLYNLRNPQRPHRLIAQFETGRILAILALAVIGLSAGNYAYDSVYGTGNHWTGYGMLVLDHYSFQNTNVLTVWLKDVGPGSATVTSVYIKNANGTGPVATYTVSLTIDESALGMISENTTSQGLQLQQNGAYSLQIIHQNRVTSFALTWT